MQVCLSLRVHIYIYINMNKCMSWTYLYCASLCTCMHICMHACKPLLASYAYFWTLQSAVCNYTWKGNELIVGWYYGYSLTFKGSYPGTWVCKTYSYSILGLIMNNELLSANTGARTFLPSELDFPEHVLPSSALKDFLMIVLDPNDVHSNTTRNET